MTSMPAKTPPGDQPRVRYRDLFAEREFSALWVADVLSRAGSVIGQLAIAALVFERTGSAGLTAAAFAVTYLPHLLGGAVLATLADRWPRRETLVGTDLLRAVLILAILLPGMPLWAALALLFTVELIRIPFGAARLAILADILDNDRFAAGNGLVAATQQALQVGGFALGGILVTTVGARVSLAVDAVTYVASALILLGWLQRRPPPREAEDTAPNLWRDTAEGVRLVREAPGLSRLFGLLVLGPSILVTAEGLAIPYAPVLGGGTTLAGFLLAAAPLGSVLGLALMGRLPAPRRRALTVPAAMVVGVMIALAGTAGHPVPVLVLLFAAGFCMGYMTTIQADIAEAIPVYARGRVFGLANTGLQLGQGLAVLAAGILAEFTRVGLTLLVVGLVGAAAAAAIGVLGRRVDELPRVRGG
jgi:MFS family permease